MGATAKYALPWPEATAFARDGYAAIKQLAEAVEAVLLPPLLSTNSNGAPDWGADKTGRVPWDVTDNPDRKRGTWGAAGNAERLILPPTAGWYLVTASYLFKAKAEADWARLTVQTQKVGDSTTRYDWARTRIDIPANSDDTQLSVSSLVLVKDAADYGIQVQVEYGGTGARPTSGDAANRVNIMRVSR